MKLRYRIPHYLHPSAPLEFLQLILLVGQTLAYKLIGKSSCISYALESTILHSSLTITFGAA